MKNSILKMASLHLKKMGSGVRLAALAVICLTLTMPVSAQRGNQSNTKGSSVKLNTWDNRNFIVEIDGKRYKADGSITLKNLAPGNKRMRVIRTNLNQTHHMNNRSGRGVVLYSGTINVPRNSRVNAQVTSRKGLRILSVNRTGQTRPNGTSNRPSSSCGNTSYEPHNGQFEDHGYYQDDYYNNDNSHPEDSYGFENHGAYGGICAMEMSEFDRVIDRLESVPFSSDKKSIIRQMLRYNHISSQQLVGLLLTYSFDSDRLEVAKMAYDKVIDKENTWEINSAFTFDSTARQFEEFVSGERGR